MVEMILFNYFLLKQNFIHLYFFHPNFCKCEIFKFNDRKKTEFCSESFFDCNNILFLNT